MQNKKSVIRTLVNRAFTHCSDPNDRKIELNTLNEILIENNYPEKLIKNIINSCQAKFTNQNNHISSNFNIDRLIKIPYCKNVSENIRSILAKYDINVVFKKGLTVKNLLKPKNSSQLK